jgi:dienelactone hydrolase
MAAWNNGRSNPNQLRGRRVVRLAIASLGIVAVACVVLGLTEWVAPPRAAAQTAQSSPDVQSVQYPSGDAMIDAYIARPTGASKNPAVIIVHDDLGANNTFRELTRQCAQAGFIALAPNLLSRLGKPAVEPSNGLQPELRRTPVAGLTPYQSVEDVKAAFTFLQQDSGVDAGRISAIGVGWGEFRVWKLAEETPTLDRAVVFYGVTPPDDDQLGTIHAAVLGHYAEQDYLPTMRVLQTKKLLGDRFTYYIYPTVPGFLGGGTGQLLSSTQAANRTSLRGSPPEARAAAAKVAWTKTLDFLREGSDSTTKKF